MGKQSRGKKSRRSRPSEALDAARMEELASLDSMIRVDGEPLPVVSPRPGWEGGSDFDREVCRAGLKRFARKATDGDLPAGAELPLGSDHVLVTEIAPGIRQRLGLAIVWNHEMN